MDNQKITPLWDPNIEFPVLRRPFSVGDNSDNSNNKSSPADVAKNSKLSVEAEEWYPPGYGLPQASSNPMPVKSIQDRLKIAKQVDTNKQEQPDFQNEAFCPELDYLHKSIKVLTLKPGKFDSIVISILESLEPYFTDVSIVTKATSLIFYQALAESNFQYSGARLCAVLDKNCPIVRACLHQLCERELRSNENLSNLTLFYAEIFTQMNFELFGKCLLNALRKLLGKPSNENIKYICQTLKLSGSKLDQLDKKLIDTILDQLNAHCPSLSPSIQSLVQSVIKLRKSKWGEVESQVYQPPAEPYVWSDEPVFYGPDGVQLTSEETEFLSENLNDFILDDDDPDALWNPEPEMNEEIQAAFAEFVRSNR